MRELKSKSELLAVMSRQSNVHTRFLQIVYYGLSTVCAKAPFIIQFVRHEEWRTGLTGAKRRSLALLPRFDTDARFGLHSLATISGADIDM